jgi:excinuclease ABC subunit A
MDQSPIGRTPRSNPATYTGVFDSIRKLFAAAPESKVRGYQPGRFSFNVTGGRCEACSGDGTIKIEMHFLPDVYVPCEVCKGARYNRDTLEITFKGKNIAEVLNMPVSEALEFFSNQPSIARYMQTLVDVGLGYVRLGQSAPTLSGGEAQRVKLASELAKRSTGHTMYLLDEPTTGLHFEDVRRLLTVLSRLVDQGNTVLVIEHNLDVIKTGDWLIDLGPEGGNGGGTIVGTGTPEDIAAIAESHTGRYLAPLLGLPVPVQAAGKKTAAKKAPVKSAAKKSVATKKAAPAKTPAKSKK